MAIGAFSGIMVGWGQALVTGGAGGGPAVVKFGAFPASPWVSMAGGAVARVMVRRGQICMARSTRSGSGVVEIATLPIRAGDMAGDAGTFPMAFRADAGMTDHTLGGGDRRMVKFCLLPAGGSMAGRAITFIICVALRAFVFVAGSTGG